MAIISFLAIVGVFQLVCDVYSQQRLYEGDVCKTRDGDQWRCKKLESCASALAEIKHKKPETCGFDGLHVLVCCKPPGAVTQKPSNTKPPDIQKPSPVKPDQHRPLHHKPIPNKHEQQLSSSLGLTKSDIKCREYQKLVFKKPESIPLALEVEYEDESINTNEQSENTCGIVEEPLIYDGKPAGPKEFPHQVLLGYEVSRKIIWGRCGGSLISERFVLTAAHCVLTKLGSPKWARLGDLDYESNSDRANPQTVKIIDKFVHPDYPSTQPFNDIALLKMDSSARLDEFSRPACLNSVHDIAETQAIASGWGTTENGTLSTSLLKVRLNLIDRETCNEFYKKNIKVDDAKMLCAGDLQGRKDTCRGDSGGPLQNQMRTPACMYSLIGVTSIGRGQCGTSQPGIYTRVSYYRKWIEDIVWP